MGGSGGGGSSGSIELPSFIEQPFREMLDGSGVLSHYEMVNGFPQLVADTPELSFNTSQTVLGRIKSLQGEQSPFSGVTAYNPTADVGVLNEAISLLQEHINEYWNATTLTPTTINDMMYAASNDIQMADGTTRFNQAAVNLETGFNVVTQLGKLFDDTEIDAAVAAFQADMSARLDSDLYPRFEAGMRDVNAVVSSAFVIGRAVISDEYTRSVAKYRADLLLQRQNAIVPLVQMVVQTRLAHATLVVEVKKIQIQRATSFAQGATSSYETLAARRTDIKRIINIIQNERIAGDVDYEKKDKLWHLELYQHGANYLSSAQGGVVNKVDPPSKGSTALAGAASGAAMGAMMMPANPILGAAVGGIIGGAGAYAAS